MTDPGNHGDLPPEVAAGAERLVDALADASFAIADVPELPSESRPSRDPYLHRAALAVARADDTRNVLVFGIEPASWDFAHVAAGRGGATACTLVDHDPDMMARQFFAVPEQISRSRWVALSAAPLVLRMHCGNTAATYRHKEIQLARDEPADLIVVNGPPVGLGGRLGMVWQALTFARPGSIVLFPALTEREHAAITGLLARDPSLAGKIDCGGDGLHRVAVVCFRRLPPGAPGLPGLARPFG